MGGINVSTILMSLVLLSVFLLPSIIALTRNHPHKIPIVLTNIFVSVFWGAGWFIALIWCFILPNDNSSQRNNEAFSSADEIRKLHELKEQGVISQEEFESKKAALLGNERT
jgi:CBS domain containing-hemolysin-like protein